MLISEVPLGELDLEDSEWTPERIRAAEQRQVDIGRHLHTAFAIAPDGAVAGVSDVRIDDTDHSSRPGRASRSSTPPTAATGWDWR